jgi:hypothetical protein
MSGGCSGATAERYGVQLTASDSVFLQYLSSPSSKQLKCLLNLTVAAVVPAALMFAAGTIH